MRIGLITIGQSPRDDLVPDLQPLLPGVEIIERGALDSLSLEEIAELTRNPKGSPLVTRLRSGQGVVVGKADILPKIRACVEQLAEKNLDLIGLLCTGTFPPFNVEVPVLYPERLLMHFVAAVSQGNRVGILTPEAGQVADQRQRWARAGLADLEVIPVNPYASDSTRQIHKAAERLAAWEADLVVMDCLGYTEVMRQVLRKKLQRPVILARTVLARAIVELLGL
jgi:protein AroM